MSDAAHNHYALIDKQPRLTVAEFLVRDGDPDAREQLINGHVVAMAPAAGRHGAIVVRLGSVLRLQLSAGCIVESEGGVLFPDRDDAYYIADLIVQCAPRDWSKPGTHNPKMIIEVLSPANDRRDFHDKLLAYQTLASATAILLIDSRRKAATLYERETNGWHVTSYIGDATLTVRDPALTINLAEIYDQLFDDEAPP